MNYVYKVRMGRHGNKDDSGLLSTEGKINSKYEAEKLNKETAEKKIKIIEVLSSSSQRVLDTTQLYTNISPKIKNRLNIRNVYPDSFFKEWNDYKKSGLDEKVIAKRFLSGEFKNSKPEDFSPIYIKKILLLMNLLKNKHDFEENNMIIAGTHATLPILIPITLNKSLNKDIPEERKTGLDFNEQIDFDFSKDTDGEIIFEINRRGKKQKFSYEDINKVYGEIK